MHSLVKQKKKTVNLTM